MLNIGRHIIGLVADVGYFTDTSFLIVEIYSPTGHYLSAGPNPFSEEVTFYLDLSAGNLVSIAIFNNAGEKVWEVNNPDNSADISYKWNGHNLSGEEVSDGVYVAYVITERHRAYFKLLKIN